MDFDPIADAKALCAEWQAGMDKWRAEQEAKSGRSTAQQPAAAAPEIDPFEAEVARAEKAAAYAESQAVALDERLRAIPGMPAGYLDKPRPMGVLRNPFGSGPFANATVVMALQTSQYPDAARLIPLLCERAGIAPPPIDYKGIAAAKKRAEQEANMAQMAAELRASREKAMHEYRTRLQGGSPKTPIPWKQGIPFPEHLRGKVMPRDD